MSGYMDGYEDMFSSEDGTFHMRRMAPREDGDFLFGKEKVVPAFRNDIQFVDRHDPHLVHAYEYVGDEPVGYAWWYADPVANSGAWWATIAPYRGTEGAHRA